MKLHGNKELFQDAVTASSQQKGIPEIYVEKDYWVTLALHAIFNNEICKETVFNLISIELSQSKHCKQYIKRYIFYILNI